MAEDLDRTEHRRTPAALEVGLIFDLLPALLARRNLSSKDSSRGRMSRMHLTIRDNRLKACMAYLHYESHHPLPSVGEFMASLFHSSIRDNAVITQVGVFSPTRSVCILA